MCLLQWRSFHRRVHRRNRCKRKKDLLRKSCRCFLCQSTKHLARNCDRRRNCRKGGGSHHQSTCDAGKAASEEKRSSVPESQDLRATTATTTQARMKTNVLLQTARTNAYVKYTNKVPVRILLDLGSQRSYITFELKDKLNLAPIASEILNLNTFGSSRYTKRRCDIVQLWLETQNKPVEITALCHPTICSPVSSPVSRDSYPHRQGLILAYNKSFNNVGDSISILIGADYYYSEVGNEVLKGDSSPTTANSEFGWLLCGPFTSTRDWYFSDTGIVGTRLVISGGINQFSSPNEEIIDAFKEIWGCDSKESGPNTETLFEDA